MAVRLLVDKYRPNCLEDYVWRDEQMKLKVMEWIKDGYVPNLMLLGQPGTGKTTLARMLMHLLEIPKTDIYTLNASSGEAHVANLQGDLESFSRSYAFGPTNMKYVLLDEADSISKKAQDFLRAEIEKEENQCRYIFTGNNRAKIHPAILSRCVEISFKVLDRDEFISRVGEILVREEVEFDYDDLESHVNLTYPDLRKCINLVEGNILEGKLTSPKTGDDGTADYLLNMVELFKNKKYNEGRKLLIARSQVDEYPSIFRFLYENLDLFGDTRDQQDDALLIVRKGLVHHSNVADPEINMSATLCELCRLVH